MCAVPLRDDWRRRRDSNPRYGNPPYGGLANRWFQPLTHVSGNGRAERYIRRSPPLQPERRGYLGMTSSRISRLIDSPGSSTRMPSSDHSSSGEFNAALAWDTGSATKIPPRGGEYSWKNFASRELSSTSNGHAGSVSLAAPPHRP